MKTVTESFDLPCTPERFWALLFDENYARALYLDAFQYKGFTLLERGESARKVRIVPKLKLPAMLDKLIGDAFAYEEHATLDRARSEWSWRMVQPATVSGKPKKDMISTRGTIRVASTGEGKCRRTDEVHIEAKLFGLGGLLESTVEKELHAAWAKEMVFLKAWLQKPPAA